MKKKHKIWEGIEKKLTNLWKKSHKNSQTSLKKTQTCEKKSENMRR